VIVGAGPAGCSAAIHARSAGLSVRIIDRATFPRDKTCGDGLTTVALRELVALGLHPSSIPSWRSIDGVMITSPSGRVAQLDVPADGTLYIVTAPRLVLDEQLVQRARDVGAETSLGLAVVDVVRNGDGWRVSCEDGTAVEAAHVFHAAGARGLPGFNQSRSPSSTDRRDELIASRVYLNNTADLEDRIHVWFRDEILPGYAWMFPVGKNRANVGVALHTAKRSPSDLVAETERVLASDWLTDLVGDSATRRGALRSWPIPIKAHPDPTDSGLLRLGDAAGLCDPMTGEGIAQALTSGRLAVESIRKHFDDPERAASTYRKSLRSHFAADDRTSRVLLRLLRNRRWTRGAVRFMGSSPAVSRWFARWMFEEIPRRAVLSPLGVARSLRTPRGARFADDAEPRP
jgi:menaquinone-9 beta-reductase